MDWLLLVLLLAFIQIVQTRIAVHYLVPRRLRERAEEPTVYVPPIERQGTGK